MVKVIDDFRIQYEKETGHAMCAGEIEESLVPKWEYVCWLEGKLYKVAQQQQGEAETQPITGDKTPKTAPQGEINICTETSGVAITLYEILPKSLPTSNISHLSHRSYDWVLLKLLGFLFVSFLINIFKLRIFKSCM